MVGSTHLCRCEIWFDRFEGGGLESDDGRVALNGGAGSVRKQLSRRCGGGRWDRHPPRYAFAPLRELCYEDRAFENVYEDTSLGTVLPRVGLLQLIQPDQASQD